jgi:leader peptidase (prepilin peptidase)/N-methyltransferase
VGAGRIEGAARRLRLRSVPIRERQERCIDGVLALPTWARGLFGFIVGCCLGSFLNVCIFRLPRDESVIRPRSRCPHCQRQLAWVDNLPLVSFALLRGRCRSCRRPIAWRYPVVEALTGLATVAVWQRFGLGPVGLIYLALICGLIVASFVDLEFRIIPDEISLGGLAVGLVASVWVPALHGTAARGLALARSATGLVVGGGLLYATASAGNVMLFGLRRLGVALRRHPRWRRRLARYRHLRESMGLGDVKLLAMAGAVLGWKPVTVAFLLAPVLAVIPGLAVMILKRSHVIPYGPFLSLGLILALFVGEEILHASGIEETARLWWHYYGWR